MLVDVKLFTRTAHGRSLVSLVKGKSSRRSNFNHSIPISKCYKAFETISVGLQA